MARCVGVSQSSIHRLIRNRLEGKKIKKTKVHALTEAAIEKRHTRALPFHNLINNRQFDYILTMDEAWLPYNVNHGQRDFFYDSTSKENRRKNLPLSVQEPAHVQKRMFAAGFSWRGPTRLYILKGDAKVNGQYFLEKIVKPMVLLDIPKLYDADADKVILHMDSAPSHTSRVVHNWLDSNGIKYFTKEQRLANSPEVSSMDFFANGYFKAELNKREYPHSMVCWKWRRTSGQRSPLKCSVILQNFGLAMFWQFTRPVVDMPRSIEEENCLLRSRCEFEIGHVTMNQAVLYHLFSCSSYIDNYHKGQSVLLGMARRCLSTNSPSLVYHLTAVSMI